MARRPRMIRNRTATIEKRMARSHFRAIFNISTLSTSRNNRTPEKLQKSYFGRSDGGENEHFTTLLNFSSKKKTLTERRINFEHSCCEQDDILLRKMKYDAESTFLV
jgi:hypothetical protein